MVSLFFYGWSDPFYIILMLISTVVDYYNGMMVKKYEDNRKKARGYVLFSIIFNLSLLGFFKYADFLIGIVNSFGLSIPLLNITLPIGISFYTFQTMSYPIDVYRRQADVQKSIIDFGTYVAMFPQLIAGPIVRYKDIATQLNERYSTSESFSYGIKKFTIGLFKKVFFANNAGAVFASITAMDSISVANAWLALIAYAFQIYFDFSGYSDMAIGLGKMFGFDLLENFNYPYISQSISEFWRRWHISLSSWFKDYVYIPLGGSRNGLGNTIRNLAIVWFLTGLWHGASLNFVLWGVYFGLIIIMEKLIGLAVLKKLPRFIRHLYTLFLILIGWMIFAFDDFALMTTFAGYLFNLDNIIDEAFLFMIQSEGLFLLLCALVSTPLVNYFYGRYINKSLKEPLSVVLVMAALLICTAYLVEASFNPFLYFRF